MIQNEKLRYKETFFKEEYDLSRSKVTYNNHYFNKSQNFIVHFHDIDLYNIYLLIHKKRAVG